MVGAHSAPWPEEVARQCPNLPSRFLRRTQQSTCRLPLLWRGPGAFSLPDTSHCMHRKSCATRLQARLRPAPRRPVPWMKAQTRQASLQTLTPKLSNSTLACVARPKAKQSTKILSLTCAPARGAACAFPRQSPSKHIPWHFPSSAHLQFASSAQPAVHTSALHLLLPLARSQFHCADAKHALRPVDSPLEVENTKAEKLD